MSKQEKGRWILVSNRLPFQPSAEGLVRSSGGLVTAVTGIRFDEPAVWVGSFPGRMEPEEWHDAVAPYEAEGVRYEPLFLEPELYDAYYNGLCNDVLWPLLHYEAHAVRFTQEAWAAYVQVNRAFAEAILAVASDGDRVWVHDFHLFLLPQMLREGSRSRGMALKIGFFLHVPFPSSEIFRQLPVRTELLEGLLHADLVGFHDYDYLRHFAATVRVVLGIESDLLTVRARDDAAATELGVFPVSIDTRHFGETAASEPVRAAMRRFTEKQTYEQLVLGVDRLDYTKGIDLKLEAFRAMLALYPELRERVRLLQIAVPSRTDVPEYVRLREDIERRIGAINGEFGRPNLVPVQYMFSGVPFEELLALYRRADVMLVTSKRDGMNLVALEYVAAQAEDDPGVVVLSEFTGSASFLSNAVPINPWDVIGTAHRIAGALDMQRAERVERHRPMLRALSAYTSTRWAASFMEALDHAGEAEVPGELPGAESVAEAVGARPLVVLLDYDGTLVPIRPTPGEATLPADSRAALAELAAAPGVTVVVVSGRDAPFLEEQLAAIPVGLGAEHGAIYRARGGEWQTLVHGDTEAWVPTALRIMEDFAARTPGSLVERKAHGASWHHRTAAAGFGAHQAKRLAMELGAALASRPASILVGHKVIEVRAVEANKGRLVRWLVEREGLFDGDPAVVVLGDDRTDEDMFAAAPTGAVTVKVGAGPTAANHRLHAQADVLPLLRRLAAARR